MKKTRRNARGYDSQEKYAESLNAARKNAGSSRFRACRSHDVSIDYKGISELLDEVILKAAELKAECAKPNPREWAVCDLLEEDIMGALEQVRSLVYADCRRMIELHRLAGRRCPKFKIGAIQMDDSCLHGIRGTGYHSPRKETLSKECLPAMALRHLHMLQENFDKNHCPQYSRCQEYRSGISQLSQLFEVLQSEEEVAGDGLSTSFAYVENQIAQCISVCLSDCSSRSRNMRRILSLVRDYRVVRPLRDGSCSVSLLRIHSILQDNYKGSYLCMLFDIFLGCRCGIAPRAVEL